MNTFEMLRSFEKITPSVIRETGIEAVQKNESVVISDSIVANAEGLTFSGNQIKNNPPFSDWEETGEFHDNLKFQSAKDIEFTSTGDGAKAVFDNFSYSDTIAPSAKILSDEAVNDITLSFIQTLKTKL